MNKFANIGIISKPDDVLISSTLCTLYQYLQNRSVNIYVDEVSANLIDNSVQASKPEDIASNCQLAIVVGGDGTILHAAHDLIESGIPILGINLGHLGFLAEISPNEINKQLDLILDGNFIEEKRFVLYANLIRDNQSITSCKAVNDVVVHAKEMVRMIELETRVNHQHLNTMRADGTIVATPTGSTAYALSGGGPILHPGIGAVVLVPICPHTLSNRPIVISEDSVVEIRFLERNKFTAVVSIDGQINIDFEPGDKLIIKKSEFELRLIQPETYDYFDVLREKLRWSASPKSK